MGLFDIFKRSAVLDEDRIIKEITKGMSALEAGSAITQIETLINKHSEAPKKGTPELLAAYNESPRIRSVVYKIAYSIASVPWYVTKKQTKGESDAIENHPAIKIIESGNKNQTGNEKMALTQASLDLVGQAYWMHDKNPMAQAPKSSIYISPTSVRKTPGVDTGGKYKIDINGREETVDPENILYFRNFDPADPFGRGSGFGTSLSDEIDTDDYAAQYTKSTLFNKSTPAGIVSIEGTNFTKQQAKALQEDWEQAHKGLMKGGVVRFANAKMAFTRIMQTFEELQLIPLRDFEAKIIFETFGVPPEIMGRIENSNRATIDSAFYLFALTVLVPRLELLKDFLQLNLMPMYGNDYILNYVSPVPADRLFKLESMKAFPWAYTRGEIRKLGGAEDRGDLDNIHVVPAGFTYLKPNEAPASIFAPADEKKKLKY